METLELTEFSSALPYLLRHKTVWSNYDVQADTIYLHFKKPNHSDQTEMTDDEIIIRHEKNEIVGLTILNVSKRKLV
jgi:uncharacterized protein YuzE